MIFFYNFQTYHHKTVQLTEHTCPKCKNRGVMKMIFNQFYTKSIFISTLPFRKFAVLYCDSCKYEIPINRWTDDLKQLRIQEIKTLKTPKGLKKGFFRLAFLFFAPIIFFALFLFYQVKFNGAKSIYDKSNNQPKNINSTTREAKSKEISEGDFYYGVVANGEDRSFGVIKIIAENAETITIKTSNQVFEQTPNPANFSISSIDQSQFNSEEKIIERDAFAKTLRLVEIGKKYPDNDIGKMHFKIEN